MTADGGGFLGALLGAEFAPMQFWTSTKWDAKCMLKDELETFYLPNKVQGELQKPKVKRPRSGTRLECGTDNVHQLRSRQLAARYLWRELLKRRYSIKLIFQNKGSKINCQQRKKQRNTKLRARCPTARKTSPRAGRRCLVPPKYICLKIYIYAPV